MTQANPEIHIFEHASSTPVFTVDTPGSIFDIDIREGADGVRVAACGKNVHANTTGRGGDLFSIHLLDPASVPQSSGLGDVVLSVRPNPFRPGGAIAFSEPSGAGARLELYDTIGRHVRSFAVDRGSSSISWDGRDATGTPAPEGVYFVRMLTEHGSVARNLVLTR
jgi:hypothetical protein